MILGAAGSWARRAAYAKRLKGRTAWQDVYGVATRGLFVVTEHGMTLPLFNIPVLQCHRAVSSLCGVSAGMGLACLAVSCLDAWEVHRGLDGHLSSHAVGQSKKVHPSTEVDMAGCWATNVLPFTGSHQDFTNRLIRKNSRVSVDEAYTFLPAPPLGTGAFGMVLHAVHKRTGIERAIKKLDKKAVSDKAAFQREVEILARTDHPNVCRLVEYFETDEHLWLVTELCRGKDLCSRLLLAPTGLPESEAVKILAQLLRAVRHCHSHAILHRDLKPENFLFERQSGQGLVKLIDFGAALQMATPMPRTASTTASTGTLLYMSPQVLRGAAPDYTDDMWSLGVIFYIMLTGQFPFSTNDDACFQDLVNRGLLEKDVKNHLANLPPTLAADLARQLLAFCPKDRPTAQAALRHPCLALAVDSESDYEEPQIPPLAVEDMRARCESFIQAGLLQRLAMTALARLLDQSTVDGQRASAAFLSLDKFGQGMITGADMQKFVDPAQERGSGMSASARSWNYTSFMASTLDVSMLAKDPCICQAAFEFLDADRDGSVSAEDLHRRIGLPQEDCNKAVLEALKLVEEGNHDHQPPVDASSMWGELPWFKVGKSNGKPSSTEVPSCVPSIDFRAFVKLLQMPKTSTAALTRFRD